MLNATADNRDGDNDAAAAAAAATAKDVDMKIMKFLMINCRLENRNDVNAKSCIHTNHFLNKNFESTNESMTLIRPCQNILQVIDCIIDQRT